MIVTAAVAAARAAQAKKGTSNLMPDLGSDPWYSGGEDDLSNKVKKDGVTSKSMGKSPRPSRAVKAPRKQIKIRFREETWWDKPMIWESDCNSCSCSSQSSTG